MSLKPTIVAGACALLPTLSAAEMMVDDPYARASSPMAQSGAAFMEIINTGDADDRLISVTSDVSVRVELHTHIMDGDIMRMVEVEEGFPIPAGESIMLERGGKHVMFLGLNRELNTGDEIEVTLSFETAGDVVVAIPVDNERVPAEMGQGHDH